MKRPNYQQTPSNNLQHLLSLICLVWVAFAVRIWQLGDVPPGWRDDELINVLVISQKVLDGQFALYFSDASGHEALYHTLHAGILATVGLNAFGFRFLSALFGTLAIPLTYQMGRFLFNRGIGWLAAAGLSLSFWSLVYSRFGERHIAQTVLVLLLFYWFWRGLRSTTQRSTLHFTLWAGFFMGLGFYNYFASRGVPLILLAFIGYIWLAHRQLFWTKWHSWAGMFALAFLLAVPLVITLSQQPEVEGRVSELAIPLVEARAGNFAPLGDYTLTTLSMFHATGDPEWLYNIPNRPVFGTVGAIFFWLGVVLALFYTLQRGDEWNLPALFLLIWWSAGIAPAFISVPPASLGHTILAQPATYLLGAWGIVWVSQRFRHSTLPFYVLALLWLGAIGGRDLPDYFMNWSQRGNVRFLYHADTRDVAHYLSDHPSLTDFAITGLLAGPWNKLALEVDWQNMGDFPIHPRWVNPERAIVLALAGKSAISFRGYPVAETVYAEWYAPPVAQVGSYQLSQVLPYSGGEPLACWQNGLCLLEAVYDLPTERLHLTWQLAQPLDLPPIPLVSNPPPVGVYAGARLWVFGQLVDSAGTFLTGDDGLWVDPQTLHTGDIFRQYHQLTPPANSQPANIHIGLYDPYTGQRILLTDSADFWLLAVDDTNQN